MTITTGAITVGSNGYTATLTATEDRYAGYYTHYRIDTADGVKVGTVATCEGYTLRATARTNDGTEVTTEWLDLFNDDNGDRDEHTALDRAADAIAAALDGTTT